jgi:hypothetical protein
VIIRLTKPFVTDAARAIVLILSCAGADLDRAGHRREKSF